LIAGTTELALQPALARNREMVDEELTLGEAAFNVGVAATFGFAAPYAIEGIGRTFGLTADATVGKLFEAMPESVQRRWASRMTVDDMPIEEFIGGLSNQEVAAFSRDALGDAGLTSESRAAIGVLEELEAVGNASPYTRGLEGDVEHQGRLAESISEILDRNRCAACGGVHPFQAAQFWQL